MKVSSFVQTSVTLLSAKGTSGESVTLSSASTIASSDGKTLVVDLGSDDVDKITGKRELAISLGSTFLSLTSTAFTRS